MPADAAPETDDDLPDGPDAVDTVIGAAVRQRIVDARPALDPVARDVMRSNAAAALFGKKTAVTIGRYQLVREVGTGGGGTVFLAIDPELDRSVAVKLIVADDPAVRARAVAEGQALAKLSHPHVVQVFDVGVVGERVYLVMELVKGESLRAYAEDAPVRDVIRAYRQAGDGIVAAHDAGLVHRDFKPDNAMRGADGRVRVVDFGLAGAEGDPALGGTPQYMAPEQAAGAPATVAADQYAFAASLREAAGRAGGVPLPRWLDAIVERGTAAAPGDRYASMAALLAALANDPRRKWSRRALIAAPIVLGVVGFAVGRRGDDAPALAACDQGAAAIAPAWTSERAAAADAHVVGLGTPFAAAAAPRTRDVLAGYATQWIKGFDAACVAARREPSTTVVAHRSACLSSARTQLGALVDLVTAVKPDDLPSAIRATAELPDLDRCADAAALIADIAPPTAAQALEVAKITEELDRARVEIDAALPSATAKTEAAVAHARVLGYQPLLAVALLAHGRALFETGGRKAAVAPLAEAADLAIAERDDITAVEASARLVLAQTSTDAPSDVVLAGAQPIAALARRLGPRDQFPVALLHNQLGQTEQAAGHRDLAEHELRTALPLARQITGHGAVELAWVRSNLALVIDDPTEQQTLRDEAIAVARDRLGAEHPTTLRLELGAAFALTDASRSASGMRAPCMALATLHPSQAPAIVDWCYELAIADVEAGAVDDARRSLALVIAADRPDVKRVKVDIAKAFAMLLADDAPAARAAFAEVAAAHPVDAKTPWFDLIFAADTQLGLAAASEAASATAARVRAVDYLERAAAASPMPAMTRRLAWARATP